jgi:hypothetical protein
MVDCSVCTTTLWASEYSNDDWSDTLKYRDADGSPRIRQYDPLVRYSREAEDVRRSNRDLETIG